MAVEEGARHEYPRRVTLLDGRSVWSDSEEWRAETEAMRVAAMQAHERRAWFEDIERIRGPEAAGKLRDDVAAVLSAWFKRDLEGSR